jgi:hypothetical protein
LTRDLLQALEASDVVGASELFREKIRKGEEAWPIHLSLFPAVQRVLNPPFVNAHLPKMYAICRDLVTYLQKEEILALVQLEITEYAKKPKMEKLPRAKLLTTPISFKDIESALREQDWEKATVLMATFHAQAGGTELARRLLLLGSGYLDDSLGHSVSCTAFILLEMMEQADRDPWPALATISDFFCKAEFHTTPLLRRSTEFLSQEALHYHLLRATSGRGIVNLHHTITHYAIERTRPFFSKEEYDHLTDAWIAFLEDKRAEQVRLDRLRMEKAGDYNQFYETFSKLETKSVVASLGEMIDSQQGRQQLGRFLIKGLCDQYRGHYNPHYLTGLGSTLWMIDRYWNQTPIALNALFQYVDFYFEEKKSKNKQRN